MACQLAAKVLRFVTLVPRKWVGCAGTAGVACHFLTGAKVQVTPPHRAGRDSLPEGERSRERAGPGIRFCGTTTPQMGAGVNLNEELLDALFLGVPSHEGVKDGENVTAVFDHAVENIAQFRVALGVAVPFQ
jgi:hypothetical protein